jgi:DNA-binding CsgD family transcriptional regulator
MERLTGRDVRRLLELLRVTYTWRDLDGFRDELIPQLVQLIHSDFTGYRSLDPPYAIAQGHFWPSDYTDPHRMQPIFARYVHEHPLLGHHLATGDGRALKISDFLTQRQFHDLGLYQEVYRVIGIEDVLAITLPVTAPGTIGVSFHVQKPRFSERDRLLANLLRPHLAQAHLNAQAATPAKDTKKGAERELETVDRGVMIVTDRRRVSFATAKAQEWAAAYFGRSQPLDSLPDTLQRWVTNECARFDSTVDVPAPRLPLVLQRGERRLTVRLLADSRHLLLLFKEQRERCTAAALERLGLTRRETEVLVWLTEGKTNAEIGTIIGARPRTVAKHLENIYQKLGVETRTAAAVRALTASTTRE